MLMQNVRGQIKCIMSDKHSESVERQAVVQSKFGVSFVIKSLILRHPETMEGVFPFEIKYGLRQCCLGVACLSETPMSRPLKQWKTLPMYQVLSRKPESLISSFAFIPSIVDKPKNRQSCIEKNKYVQFSSDGLIRVSRYFQSIIAAVQCCHSPGKSGLCEPPLPLSFSSARL